MLISTLPMIPVSANPKIIVVPDDYPTIQEAINAATSGDTIYVHNGTYYENVIVNKTVSLVGEDKYNTIVDGSGIGTVMNVTAINVNITGFTIQNSRIERWDSGIYVKHSSGNNISHNIITNNWDGITLDHSSNNVLAENDVSSNTIHGIDLEKSNQNTITGNNASNNPYGITLDYSSNNTIIGNVAFSNRWAGIKIYKSNQNTIIGNVAFSNRWLGLGCGVLLMDSDQNTITGNNASSNDYGIYLSDYSSSNIISGNNASSNDYGITLDHSSNNVLAENDVSSNINGIYLFRSKTNVLTCNKIYSNSKYGIDLDESNQNTITGNNASSNRYGISLYYSLNNILLDNNAPSNYWSGIGLSGSGNNILAGNNASNSNIGIQFSFSRKNKLAGNAAFSNFYGIWLSESSNNTVIHNNFINNTKQVYDYSWDHPESPSINTWDNGYPSGGNYWSDYEERYPNATEVNDSGIWDTPYEIDVNNQDNYPLVSWSPPPSLCTLTVYSSPTGVTFTVDGVSRSTPWSEIYIEGTSAILEMPETQYGYVWSHWLEDGDPNRIKTVIMDTNITLTAVYTLLDITPPTISIVSPENKTYAIRDVPLTFTVSESTSWMGYSLDGRANVTITGNTTLFELFDGAHTITVYANDTAGNMGFSDMVYFTIQTSPIDTTPPSISIVSPMNETYATTDIPLTFTVDESVSWIAYSLDNQANVTITGNTTLSGLSDGLHTLIVYAKDNAGNVGTSEIIYFNIETPEPFPIWIIAVIVIVVITSVAVLVWRYRKRKQRPLS